MQLHKKSAGERRQVQQPVRPLPWPLSQQRLRAALAVLCGSQEPVAGTAFRPEAAPSRLVVGAAHPLQILRTMFCVLQEGVWGGRRAGGRGQGRHDVAYGAQC